MGWSIDSSSSSTADYKYYQVYDTGTANAVADTRWRVPAPVTMKATLGWTISPPEADDLLVGGDISAPVFEKRLMEQVEKMVVDRLQQLLPLYIDAIRWGRPEESYTGSRCIICGAPAKNEDECAYCGR